MHIHVKIALEILSQLSENYKFTKMLAMLYSSANGTRNCP